MTLEDAVAVLAAHGHGGTSDWGVAFDGRGERIAFGWHWNARRQFRGISLPADIAERVASQLQGDA